MIAAISRWWIIRRMPVDHLRQLNTLLVMAGRRAAYDLLHAADDIVTLPEPTKRQLDHATMWRARGRTWLSVFNPADGGKNYLTEMHHDLRKQKREIERLRRLCAAHNIDHRDPDEIPF